MHDWGPATAAGASQRQRRCHPGSGTYSPERSARHSSLRIRSINSSRCFARLRCTCLILLISDGQCRRGTVTAQPVRAACGSPLIGGSSFLFCGRGDRLRSPSRPKLINYLFVRQSERVRRSHVSLHYWRFVMGTLLEQVFGHKKRATIWSPSRGSELARTATAHASQRGRIDSLALRGSRAPCWARTSRGKRQIAGC
jgi:hypothetical protein